MQGVTNKPRSWENHHSFSDTRCTGDCFLRGWWEIDETAALLSCSIHRASWAELPVGLSPKKKNVHIERRQRCEASTLKPWSSCYLVRHAVSHAEIHTEFGPWDQSLSQALFSDGFQNSFGELALRPISPWMSNKKGDLYRCSKSLYVSISVHLFSTRFLLTPELFPLLLFFPLALLCFQLSLPVALLSHHVPLFIWNETLLTATKHLSIVSVLKCMRNNSGQWNKRHICLYFWLILYKPVPWQLIACTKLLTEQVASCLLRLPSTTWASTSIWRRSIASETPFSCTSHSPDWLWAISVRCSVQCRPNLNCTLNHHMQQQHTFPCMRWIGDWWHRMPRYVSENF